MIRRSPHPRQAPTQLRFAKMHGLGNDFMIADLVTQRRLPSAAQIRAWADRRSGVGFDQFLAVLPPDDPDADFRYRIFNADGSESEQCGNGARCFARFVVEQGLTPKRELVLQTAAGDIRTKLARNGQVRVAMGVPSIEPAEVPFVAALAEVAQAADAEANGGSGNEAQPLSYWVAVGGERLELTPVSLGNPHAVLFVDSVADADVARIGAALQQHACFPKQVNVGFLQVRDRRSGCLRVYERGSGETRACGSGAAAAMVAGRLHGRFDAKAKLTLPGGKLRLAWRGPGAVATLAGAAQLVYEGHIDL